MCFRSCGFGWCTTWGPSFMVAMIGLRSFYYREWISQDREDIKLPNLAAAPPPVNYTKRNWQQHYWELMDEVKETENPQGINPKCDPYIIEPEEGKPVHGLQILIHGFLACPGQWYNLAPRLVKKDWIVMAPLQPGHGRMPQVKGRLSPQEGYDVEEYMEDLPTKAIAYAIFAKELVSIARKFRQENPEAEIVLTGMSSGGTAAMKIILDALEVWDKVLILNPFMSLPSSMLTDFGFSPTQDIIQRLVPFTGFVRGNMSYGETCIKKFWPGNSGGTGASCALKSTNLQKVIDFANIIEREFRHDAYYMGIFSSGTFDKMLGLAINETGMSSNWLGVRNKQDRRCCCKPLRNGTTCKLLSGNELRMGRAQWSLFCPSQLGYQDFRRYGFKELPSSCAEDLELLSIPSIKKPAKVQLVTTLGDATIANSRIDMISKVLMTRLDTDFSLCVLPKDVGHVYIAPIDHYHKDHWWLVPERVIGGKIVLDLLEEYLDAGDFVPKINGKKSTDHNLPDALMCKLERVPGDLDQEPLGLNGSTSVCYH